jgi:hypothetical protein
MIPVFLLMLLALDARMAGLIRQVAVSGQVIEIATPPSERLMPAARIAPGVPPLVSFRAFEGKLRHRFGDLDLVLDDAGH